MQFKNLVLSATLAAVTVSAAGYTPGEPWSTLTPTGTGCGVADYTSAFGIAVETIAASKGKRDVISQIADGQIQATAVSTKGKTTTLAPTTSTTSTSSASKTSSSVCTATATEVSIKENSCKNEGTLEITLKDGVLTDSKGRIGSIVSNRQFQFDGPTPQAGAIYAAGWSITEDGNLALGGNDVFYQCLSGNFYNLYDEHIAEQCSEIHLQVVNLVSC